VNKKIKIILALVVVIAVMCMSVMPFGAIEIKRYYGDVNNDGYVTTKDARIILMVVAQIYDKPLLGLDFEAADLDDDGQITTVDARLVLKTAAGQLAEEFMTGYEFSEHHEDFAKIINDYRFEKDHTLIKLTLNDDLCQVARIAAQEYALHTNTAFIREDGSLFNTLLDEYGIEYTFAEKIVIHSGFGYKQVAEEILEDFQNEKTLTSSNFSKIGVGAYSTDGRTFYWCVFVTK
jgi:uncharacterized protein YkwD